MSFIHIQLRVNDAHKAQWCAVAQQFNMHCQEENEAHADVVVFDPSECDWHVLSAFQADNPHADILLVLDKGNEADIRAAIDYRPFDLLFHPVKDDALSFSLQKIHAHRLHQKSIQQDTMLLEDKPIGNSAAFKHVLKKIEQVANTYLPVLLTGETGTGKGAVAKYLHRLSGRANYPFHIVNCGAIAPGVLESELFGHEKGAFSGAVSRRIGLLEYANGGTVLLDEINSATPELQVRLLDFIQEGTIKRVGSNLPIAVDVRLVFATNQSLTPLVETGLFRADLYYRMNVYPVEIPNLKNRRDDIPLLAAKFMTDYAKKLGVEDIQACAPGVLDVMTNYDWPGNVRQLENMVQRLLISAKGRRIELSDLPAEMRLGNQKVPAHLVFTKVNDEGHMTLKELESRHIRYTLNRCAGNKSVAAKCLGINTTTLWRKLKESLIEA